MDNLIDGLEFRDTPQGLLGIARETWGEIEGELEKDYIASECGPNGGAIKHPKG